MAIEIRGMTPLIQVFDMPTSMRFYRDTLGFEVVSADNNPADHYEWVLLRLGGAELMLNTAYEADERLPAPDPARVASHGDTALFFGCPDVDATYELFRSRGVDLEEPKIAHYGFKGVTFKDPDGYCLCFHWPVT
jgi:catechol 2,3-dioxygenase-like lactoylglutathione lyase family enzyme